MKVIDFITGKEDFGTIGNHSGEIESLTVGGIGRTKIGFIETAIGIGIISIGVMFLMNRSFANGAKAYDNRQNEIFKKLNLIN